MKIYYVHDGQSEAGPYSIDELSSLSLTADTMVWTQGMQAWQPINTIAELSGVYNTQLPPIKPPVFAKTSSHQESPINVYPTKKKGNGVKQLLIITLLLVGSLIVAWLILENNKTSNYGSTNYIVEDPEHAFPQNYLPTGGVYNKNLFGNKITIKGSVQNTATHTNYKDLVVKVSFYSSTKSVIDTREFMLYDYYPYGRKKEFSVKTEWPSVAKSCGWEIVRAAYY